MHTTNIQYLIIMFTSSKQSYRPPLCESDPWVMYFSICDPSPTGENESFVDSDTEFSW